jgi:hypothetical protein
MLAANYDITLDRAAEYTFVLTIQTQSSAAVDLATATAYAEIRNSDTKKEVAAFTPIKLNAATGTITFGGLPLNNDTITVGSTTYTFKTTAAATNDVQIGLTAAATAQNLLIKLATNTDANGYIDGTVVTVFARTGGTAGNSVVLTESATNVTVSGSGTLTGGVATQSNEIKFLLNEAQTLLLNSSTNYEYDIFLQRDSDTMERLLYGTVTVRPNIYKGVPVDPLA